MPSRRTRAIALHHSASRLVIRKAETLAGRARCKLAPWHRRRRAIRGGIAQNDDKGPAAPRGSLGDQAATGGNVLTGLSQQDQCAFRPGDVHHPAGVLRDLLGLLIHRQSLARQAIPRGAREIGLTQEFVPAPPGRAAGKCQNGDGERPGNMRPRPGSHGTGPRRGWRAGSTRAMAG